MANTLPEIEIRVFTYNQAQFIHDTLESVLIQDYPHFKCFVHDDGSTDGTSAIIEDYARRYPDKIIPRLSEKNQGLMVSFNRALSETSQAYLFILGGDDLMMPGRVTQQMKGLLANPNAVLSTSAVEIFFENGTPSYVVQDKVFGSNPSTAQLIAHYRHLPSSSFAIRFEKCRDLRADTRLKTVNDWMYFIEVAKRGDVIYHPQILTRYRRHDNNLTAAGAERSYLDDRLIAGDLYLVKYGENYFSLRRHRSNCLYSHAKRLYKDKHFPSARRFAFYAWMEWKTNLKAVLFWLVTLIGPRSYSAVLWFRKKIRWAAI
jgi:glycosyltransferase involved in cell wall biosynthesis